MVRAQLVLAAILVLASLVVRGIESTPPAPPAVDPDSGPVVQEPMQLLLPGAVARLDEMDPLVEADVLPRWVAARETVAALEDCPDLADWLAGDEGRSIELLLGELARSEAGGDGLAGIALVVAIARRTEWEPGVFGGSEHAERLGGLLQEWLDGHADASVDDPLLYEPALAAAVLYGSVMHRAFEGGWFGDSDASLERARGFLERLIGARAERPSDFGLALKARYPAALPEDGDGGDEDEFLEGFAEERELLFPDLDGECD
ncbi:MAG: hypothetical protein O7B99_03125 [Planctomycetota bacterium]|nr:hypothetical protein [Planctomycetota bacterium]